MATNIPSANENVRNLEQRLLAVLEGDGVRRLGEIARVLEQIRMNCTSAILRDIRLAVSAQLEDRLWSAHQRVHTSFRQSLGKLKAEGNGKLVEHRKLGSEYLKFIKSSQKFYRGYVRDLASKYGGIPELERVAKKLHREYTGNDQAAQRADQAVERLVLLSCHRTLIQLGDLSRYRETELGGEPKNWAPAIGFYDLAGALLPKSGIHHNQLAVVAQADGQYFRAAYHIYRAILAEEPHPGAEENLRKMLAKVASKWDSGDLLRNASTMDANNGALIAWYLRLHFMLFRGRDFAGRLDLEQEILTQTERLIKQAKSSSLTNRLVLVNIASSSFAQAKFEQKPESEDLLQAYLFFLRQNMQFLSLFFRLFSHELGSLAGSGKEKHELTTTMERVLPALNIYSLWLHNNVAVTAKAIDETFNKLHLEFWSNFAKCLTLTAELFPANQLPQVDWLLEEEADTMGFRPLQGNDTNMTWEKDGKPKPYRHEVNHVKDDFNREMLHRVRVFLIVGLKLAMNDTSPLEFDAKECAFRCTVPPQVESSTAELPSGQLVEQVVPSSQNQTAMSSVNTTSRLESSALPNVAIESLQHENLDEDAERMVDSLVGNGEAHESPLGEQPLSLQPTDTHTAADLVNSFQGYSRASRSSVSPGAVAPFMARGSSGSQPHSQEQSPSLHHRKARLSTSSMPFGMTRTSSRGGLGSSIDVTGQNQRSPTSPGPSSRPGTATGRQNASLSPSNPQVRHHRVRSTDSTRSQGSIWAHESTSGWPSGAPDTMSLTPQPFGNGTFGTGSQEHLASSSAQASPKPYGLDSPLLFGTSKSIWSNLTDDSKPYTISSSRVSATPLRGSAPAWNGSPRPAP